MKAQPESERTSAGAQDTPGDAERLSAWLDGELDAPAAEPLVQQLLSGQALLRKYQSWCFLGDALRSQEVAAAHSPRLHARICRALQDEPALLAPRALSSRVKHNVASAVAVAAAMAVVVLVAVPLLRQSGPSADQATHGMSASGAAPSGLAARKPDSPALGSVGLAADKPADARSAHRPRLDPYIQAHRDFTADGVMPAAAIYLRSGNEGDR